MNDTTDRILVIVKRNKSVAFPSLAENLGAVKDAFIISFWKRKVNKNSAPEGAEKLLFHFFINRTIDATKITITSKTSSTMFVNIKSGTLYFNVLLPIK